MRAQHYSNYGDVDSHMRQRQQQLEDELRRARMALSEAGHAAVRANMAVEDAWAKIAEIEAKISRVIERRTVSVPRSTKIPFAKQ